MNTEIKNAKTLTELCGILNKMSESYSDLSDHFDLSALPTFGGPDVRDTSEVYSWDEFNILTNSRSHDNEWSIEARCGCGEANFNCNC